MRKLLLLVALVVTLFASVPAARAQSPETDWRITNFVAVYVINEDGIVHVNEDIDTTFTSNTKHGIFRDLDNRIPCGDGVAAPAPNDDPSQFSCPEGQFRVYRITNIKANAVGGVGADISHPSSNTTRIRIGDPNATVTGAQHYHISYDVAGAFNPFTKTDELYWNATGHRWVVPIDKVAVSVSFPGGTSVKGTCYQGSVGDDTACKTSVNGSTAVFSLARGLGYHQGLTFAVSVPKGAVSVPPPIVEKDFSPADLFTLDWIEYAGVVVTAAAGILWLAAMWWRHGRDRRYRTIFYLDKNAKEETKPLFANKDIVVEYLPPDGLRPAQMGVILDERADTLDVTATIIDLAVRGYLHITEIPKEGLFGHKDWKLTKGAADEGLLLPYELQLYRYLFASRDEVEISDLKNKFANKLKNVEKKLYDDAMGRKWFDGSPENAKVKWLFVGFGVILLGALLCAGFGWFMGRLLIGVPIVVAGLAMIPLSRVMARRTATGSEALRRVLGFRLYVSTAETRKQEFNEKQDIFAAYLPFAIVFGCVGKWAKAFDDIDNEMVSSWYTGTGAFNALVLSSSLSSFSSSVSSSIASTPGSSGGSGFSGGSSGGGGGGGGGGSW